MSSGFPCVASGMERFSLELQRAAKKEEYVLWRRGVGVCLDRECMEFVTAGWYKVGFYDFKI